MRAWHDDRFRLEVEDTSSALPAPAAACAIGGQGLLIIDKLASRWGSALIDAGKVVWAEFEPLAAAAEQLGVDGSIVIDAG